MTAISNSEMAAWSRCPRSWLVHYYLGMQPVVRNPCSPAQLGTRVHTAMEGLYGYGLDPLLVLKLLYQAELAEHPEFDKELRSEWDLANAMVTGCGEWMISEGTEADFKVIATEQDVQVPLPGVPGVELRGRLDQAVEQVSTGFRYFRDWKTSDSLEDHQVMELNPQFKLYSVIMHLMAGIPFGILPPGSPVVNGGLVTTMRRCKRTERSKPPYYQQDQFRYNPEQLSATLARTQQLCTEIMNARAALDWCWSENGGQGQLAAINQVQRTVCRPVPILRDCRWRCELSRGVCVSMDDGAAWLDMLHRSGAWQQQDPYAYYERDGLASIKSQLAAL